MGDHRFGKDVMARLRRATASDDVFMDEVAERFGLAVFEMLDENQAALLERIVSATAQAAEELGPDATVEAIAQRARRIERQPH